VSAVASAAVAEGCGTVDRRLVHKAALEEVFLSRSSALGPEVYMCSGQLPRMHAFFNDVQTGRYDVVLLVEFVRQAAVLVAHRHLGVALGRQFVFTRMELDMDIDRLRVGAEPAELEVRLTLGNERRIAGDLAAYELDGVLTIAGDRVAVGSGACMCLGERDYADVRAAPGTSRARVEPPDGTRVSPAAPASVGRSLARNVTTSAVVRRGPGAFQAAIHVDAGHPTFFDHPLDHVPALLLLEAGRQTAVAAAAAELGVPATACCVDRCAMAFDRFVELGQPAECHATVQFPVDRGARRAEVDVAIRQGGDCGRIALGVAGVDAP
jgi:hypothetical protein